MLFNISVGSPLAAIQPPLPWWGLTLAALLLVVRLDVVIDFFRGRLLGAAKVALQASAVTVLSAVLGPVWKFQWEFAGWPGPPSWTTELFEVFAGESSWTVDTKMVVSLCIFLGCATVIANLWSAIRPNFAW